MHYIVSMSSEIIKYPQQWHFKVLSYLNIKGRSGGMGSLHVFARTQQFYQHNKYSQFRTWETGLCIQ